MRRTIASLFSVFFSLPLLFGPAAALELGLQSAGASQAPLDLSQKSLDPTLALSQSQRNDLLGEFKGLVQVGLKKTSFEDWKAKEMADCTKPQSREDRWTYRCEIITGQGNGYYYFFPNQSRSGSTLQELDIQMHVADERVLEDFRKPVQELLGRASFVEKTAVRAKASGRIRHWNSGDDVAELFIDHAVRPEGSVRFVWIR